MEGFIAGNFKNKPFKNKNKGVSIKVKKAISILLVLMLVVMLAGCGTAETGEETPEPNEEASGDEKVALCQMVLVAIMKTESLYKTKSKI